MSDNKDIQKFKDMTMEDQENIRVLLDKLKKSILGILVDVRKNSDNELTESEKSEYSGIF